MTLTCIFVHGIFTRPWTKAATDVNTVENKMFLNQVNLFTIFNILSENWNSDYKKLSGDV